jgi:glycosyltransferase involved in cell wall biosynthesis
MARTLCIVVPAYNEAQVIAGTLAGIPAALPGAERIRILVVDDGSRDQTAARVRELADPRVVLVRHAINRGLGGALGTGLAWARAQGVDFAITFDADGQHAAEDLAKVLGPLAAGEADAVIGSRLLDPTGMPWYRIVGNWGLNVITWASCGLWTTDSQSGLRGFSRAALQRLELRFSGMEASSELIAQIRIHRLRFVEVPIRAIYSGYSLAKGQRNSNGIRIVLRLLSEALLGD